jgi:hypothetical protein
MLHFVPKGNQIYFLAIKSENIQIAKFMERIVLLTKSTLALYFCVAFGYLGLYGLNYIFQQSTKRSYGCTYLQWYYTFYYLFNIIIHDPENSEQLFNEKLLRHHFIRRT